MYDNVVDMTMHSIALTVVHLAKQRVGKGRYSHSFLMYNHYIIGTRGAVSASSGSSGNWFSL